MSSNIVVSVTADGLGLTEGGRMLMIMLLCSPSEYGIMLAKPTPPCIRIFNTRQRGIDYPISRIGQFRSYLCTRLLRIICRGEFPYQHLLDVTHFGLSMF